MSLTLRNCERRRRPRTDEKLPGGPGETSARAMAPTQMKLRVRRRGAVAADAAAEGGPPEEEEERRRPGGARSGRRKSSGRASAAGASPSPPGSASASAHAGVMVAEDASPDSKCPICLDRFNNLAYLDRCLHRFCFPCIQEWSHNKAECPLCKQPFASILHSVRAEDDFKEYTLQPAPPNSSVAATVAMVAAMASAARSNHQMRLMLRRHRGAEAAERRRRRERRGRRRSGSRTRERVGVGEWYLDSSVSLPPLPRYPPASPALTDNSEEAEDLDEQRMSEGAASPDGGVIFESMMRLGGAVAPLTPTNRDSRRMMSQLAARRRMQQDGGTARHLRERETVAFRRDLYRCGVRVSGVAAGGIQGHQQQQQEVSAEAFRRRPELLARLRPWLRRELTVLYGSHGSLVDIIQRIIMARLARHGLEDTPTVEEELRPFLLARTEHFLHELLGFARSPLSLESYDLQALYPPPAAAPLEAIGSSSDRDSIIAISEGEEERGPAGGGEDGAGGAGSDVIRTRSSLSQSAWDDETPGPSYSAAEPSCSLSSLSFSPAPQEAANEEDGEKEEEGEECLIVGYKKPIAERTPELVQLSSDSEEEEEEEEEEKDKLPLPPRTTPPLLHLPTIPPSTSGTNRREQEEELREEDGGVSQLTFCPGRGRKERQEQGGGEERSSQERRRQRREEGGRRRSGTLSNPNRCIYPAMMRPRSPSSSPLRSSAESSPPDSSWEYSCSQLSPLASSLSSPSRLSWSSSPPRSPPHLPERSPPPPSAPPCERGEKPGGKRKYKSRHLDSSGGEPSWKQRRSSQRRGGRRERKKKERRRRPRQDGRRRERAPPRSSQGGGRRSREERSPSVEIIYEGPVGSSAAARRRRRKHEPRTQPGSCPIIITLDSDGSCDGVDAGGAALHQQTLDLSDLLPLPLLLPDDLCPTTEGRPGFPGLDQEPPRHTQDGSDHDVDVETVEGRDVPLGLEEGQRSEVFSVDSSSQAGGRSDPAVSDRRLLASILGDLQVATQPKWSWTSRWDGRPANDPAVASGPVPELPPLLKQVSPVRSFSRNTPPPLRRSDAPSPRPSRDCACTTNHKPCCPPGPAPQSASGSGDGGCSPPSALQPSVPPAGGPSAHTQPTSTERRSSDTPPGGPSAANHLHLLLGDCGAEGHPSPAAGGASSVLATPPSSGCGSDSSCRSSQAPPPAPPRSSDGRGGAALVLRSASSSSASSEGLEPTLSLPSAPAEREGGVRQLPTSAPVAGGPQRGV